jgi:hypothetical protein
MNLRRHGFALALTLAVIGGSGAALVGGVGVAAESGLSQQTAQALVQQQTPAAKLGWQDVQIGAPRMATAHETAAAHLVANATVYPVAVDQAATGIRAAYLVYRDAEGRWTAVGDAR